MANSVSLANPAPETQPVAMSHTPSRHEMQPRSSTDIMLDMCAVQSCDHLGPAMSSDSSRATSPPLERSAIERESAEKSCFSRRFKLSLVLVLSAYAIGVSLLVGACLILEKYDQERVILLLYFSEFLFLFNYNLMRLNNQRRLLVFICGSFGGIFMAIPGWVSGASFATSTSSLYSVLMNVGVYMTLAFFLSWMVLWVKTLKPYLFGSWRYETNYLGMAPLLKTGDVVLCSATTLGSQFIKLFSASNYSHVAIIIKDPSDKVLQRYYIEEDMRDPHGIYVWEATPLFLDHYEKKERLLRDVSAERHAEGDMRQGGVQLNPLRNWLAGYDMWEGSKSVVTVRRLVGGHNTATRRGHSAGFLRLDFAKELEGLMLDPQLSRAPYETSVHRCIGGMLGWNTCRSLDSAFCSELVGMALHELQLLRTTEEDNWWQDFCCSTPWGAKVQPSNTTPEDYANDTPLLVHDVFLGPPIRLTISEAEVNDVRVWFRTSRSLDSNDHPLSPNTLAERVMERKQKELETRKASWASLLRREGAIQAAMQSKLEHATRKSTELNNHLVSQGPSSGQAEVGQM